MDFALFSRKSVLALMGLTLGVSAAFYVRRLVNPYAAAYPVAAIWLITLLLLTLGVVATLKVQWRSSGIGLLVAVGSFLAAFGLSSMALETREQELLEIVQGASVRVYLKPGTDEDQLTAFLCQYVYRDCEAATGKTLRPGIVRLRRADGELIITTTIEYQKSLLLEVEKSGVVARAELEKG